MADSYLERVAGELADLALADQQRTKDENVINEISSILGSSSQTLQEAFLTAIRVRRAEERARALLTERSRGPNRVKSRLLIEDAEELPTKGKPHKEDAVADALSTLDEFLQDDEEKPIAPSRPSRK